MTKATETGDYARVFKHLCHVVALRRKGQLSEAVDNLVLAALHLEEPQVFDSVLAVDQGLQVYFGLQFGVQTIEDSCSRLLSKQRIKRDPVTKGFALAPDAKTALEASTAQSHGLEETVRQEWLLQVATSKPDLSQEEKQTLWRCLTSYMTKAFRQHGLETIQLLQPHVAEARNIRNLSALLGEAFREINPPCNEDELRDFVNSFFVTQTAARTRYVSQLLDSTFTYFALSIDKETAQYLRDSLDSLSIFLDTNFIFGILGLHDNPLADLSKELVQLIKEHKFPFKLYYHAETLAELERTIFAIGQRLRSRAWNPALSKAAARFDGLSGIERQFHQLNSRQPTDPEAFISQFEHVVDLLRDHGYAIYRPPAETEVERQRRHELCGEYDEYIRERRPNNPKPYGAIDHDIAVLMTVQGIRRKDVSPLRAGAIFLSCDYTLHMFESRVLAARDRALNAVVLPNQLWQLLRPFVPTSDDFNKSFVEAFAMPAFRASAIEHSATYSKVLTYLASYSSLSERTAVRVLSNDLLFVQLKGVKETDPQFQELIESSLAQDNEVLLEEREGLVREKQELEQQRAREREELAAKLEERQRLVEELQKANDAKAQEIDAKALELARATAETSTVRSDSQRTAAEHVAAATTAREKAAAAVSEARAKSDAIESELAAERQRAADVARVRGRERAILAVLLALVFGGVVISLPSLVGWEWLAKHENRVGLYVAAVFIAWAAMWAIFDSKRRLVAIGACLFPIVLTLISLLGK